MPDVALATDDYRRVEAIDVVLARVAVGIAAAKAEGDARRVSDGYRLASAWLERRLRYARG